MPLPLDDPRAVRIREINATLAGLASQQAELTAERLELLRELRASGVGMSEIALAVELARQRLYQLLGPIPEGEELKPGPQPKG